MPQNQPKDDFFNCSPSRRAVSEQGAKKYALALWKCLPGSKIKPRDARLSVLIQNVLDAQHSYTTKTNNPACFEAQTIFSFTRRELHNIKHQLEILEAAEEKIINPPQGIEPRPSA